MRASGRPWIGVISFSPDTSWIQPELRAWLTYFEDGRYRSEPADIKEV